MNATTAIAAKGKVTSVKEGMVVFCPTDTNYELHLVTSKFDGPVGRPVKCVIRVVAKKVLTVPSGGNFIVPIFGPPRIVQGRVRAIEGNTIVVQAGAPVYVELPWEESAIDQDEGPIAVGKMVNVLCQPGAKGEFEKP